MSDQPVAPTHKHKFRYLLPPGNNFAFVAKFKIWIVISILLMTASVTMLFVNHARRGSYMNWTIDFKGGTNIIYSFTDAKGDFVTPDPAKLREALDKTGETGFEVSEYAYTGQDQKGDDVAVKGSLLATPRFSALTPEAQAAAAKVFTTKFADRGIEKATWSGDRLSVRSKKLITNAEAIAVFASVQAPDPAGKLVDLKLELKPWGTDEQNLYIHPDEGTGEYNEWFSIWGLDRQYAHVFESAMPGTHANVIQSYGVGAKAGDKLRDDAAKSIVYAIFLIMLYLAFRFDIRYAPGAAFATIHDAIMVIGVFALTWREVSLTSVAGLLTVMGYSVNDTVIVFDRIRENQAKLKDKKIDKIIDISINEMLVRTILTSSTVFATTLIMNIFGAGDVQNFAFAMNIGVIVGTYSSIFLAAPIFMWISQKWYSGPMPAKRRAAPIAVAKPTDDEPDEPDEPGPEA